MPDVRERVIDFGLGAALVVAAVPFLLHGEIGAVLGLAWLGLAAVQFHRAFQR